MAAKYKGLAFDTPLLAQWAAFFDLTGWDWSTNIMPVDNWKPDFRVSFECPHSECAGSHTILVAVLPLIDISGIKGHPAFTYSYGATERGVNIADAGAVFGSNPRTTYWQMSHGAGGGSEDVPNWTDDPDQLWAEAQRSVQVLVEKP